MDLSYQKQLKLLKEGTGFHNLLKKECKPRLVSHAERLAQ